MKHGVSKRLVPILTEDTGNLPQKLKNLTELSNIMEIKISAVFQTLNS